jgi:hypothetical protein
MDSKYILECAMHFRGNYTPPPPPPSGTPPPPTQPIAKEDVEGQATEASVTSLLVTETIKLAVLKRQVTKGVSVVLTFIFTSPQLEEKLIARKLYKYESKTDRN